MEPAAPNYHPPQDICPPCCPPLLGREPNFAVGRHRWQPGQLGPAGCWLEGYLTLQSGNCLCFPEKAWGELASGLGPCLLGLPGELPAGWAGLREETPGASLGGQPGLGPRTLAFCGSHPACCRLLERARRACFHVNSTLVSRGLSKINLEISLPLALAERRLPFPGSWELRLFPGCLPSLASLCPLALPLSQCPPAASQLNPRLEALRDRQASFSPPVLESSSGGFCLGSPSPLLPHLSFPARACSRQGGVSAEFAWPRQAYPAALTIPSLSPQA